MAYCKGIFREGSGVAYTRAGQSFVSIPDMARRHLHPSSGELDLNVVSECRVSDALI